MKKCSRCNETKPLDEFQKRSKNKDGRTGMCKPCKRDYDNSHYLAHPDRKNYIKENRRKARNSATQYIYEYLTKHPCVDCGESDVIVLEFDHVSDDKRASVSNLKRSSLYAVKLEIEKCEVRCANCHRRKTAKQFGWDRQATIV
jgi:hypothetical protein